MIGAGHVGAAVANALVLLRVCDLVMLYDSDLARAEGEAWDIADAIPLLSAMEIRPAGSYADLADSHVVVITVGATVTPGRSRLDILGANAGVIADIVAQLDQACPDAVVVLVSNPVDVLTRIAIETSPRPPGRILGSGTVLDGARLRHELGTLLDLERDSLHAYVIGEHGDSSFPVWSSATAGAIKLDQYRLPEGVAWPQIKQELTASIRARGRSIHQRKGFTSYGVAAAVARIIRAVTRDEKRIFMVSVSAAPEYGVGTVALSLPCVVGAAGAERQLLLPLSAEEQAMLQRSAAILDEAYRSLEPGSSTTEPRIAAVDLPTTTSADP